MIIFLITLFVILLVYYNYFLLKIYRGLKNLPPVLRNEVNNHFISIIIPFRNESYNILKNITSIEELNYPKDRFEAIYVDDNSTDDSYLKALQTKKYSGIRVLKLPAEIKGRANKKYAVRYGISQSHGDIIVTTDVDCTYNKNWLNHIVNCFDGETGFVSGPVVFSRTDGLFMKIQNLEFQGLVLAGAGLINAGNPVICNGANIAYRKKIFEDVKGLDDNLHLSSGDDEFLMQKIYLNTNYKVRFCCNREAIVVTEPSSKVRNFFNQRKRWASKSLFYKNPRLIVQLLLIFMFYSGLIVQSALIIAGYSAFLPTLAVSFFLKVLLEYLIIKKGEKMLFARNQISIFLVTELLHVPYIIITSIAGIFGNFNWKDRKLNR